jgi:cytochrome P450
VPEAADAPPFDAAFLHDPYPTYRRLRAAGPVLWRDDVFQGAWVLTRHADIELALRDPRFSSQRTGGWVKRIPGIDASLSGRRAQAGLDLFQRLFGSAMVFLDGDEHQRVRKAMAAGFHPTLIRTLRADVERLTDELLDGLDARAGFDFIAEIARPLPSRVIGLMLGIARKDEARFMAWSDDLAAFIGALQPTSDQLRAAQRSLLQMVRYFDALLPARRANPGTDLVSRLLQAEAACTPCSRTRTRGRACARTRRAWAWPCANCCATTARCSTRAGASRRNSRCTARRSGGATS